MAYDLEEQETLDALKAWWERWGTLIVTLVVVAAVAVAGWRGWQWYQTSQANQAMGYFEALESAAREESPDSIPRIRAASTTLRADFPKSAYTVRAALVAASALQARNDLDGAIDQLQWLVSTDADPAFTPLARLRLAGIYLEQKRYDDALALLKNPPAAFAGLYADRTGDIQAAMGKLEEARKSWENAVQLLTGDPVQQVVQLKLDALGGA